MSGAVPGRCLARRGSAIREAKPFARFVLDCHLLRRGKCLISPISSPVLALELPVLRNNRKLLGRPCNRFESRLIFSRPAAQDPPKACFRPKIPKNSLFLRWRRVSLDCIRHHPNQRLPALRGNPVQASAIASIATSTPGMSAPKRAIARAGFASGKNSA